MNLISTILEQGVKENQEELKKDLLGLKSTKALQKENEGFDFDISLFYDLNTNLLFVEYTFTKNEHTITVYFQMSDLTFNWNAVKISTTLMTYATKYFNNEDFKVNIGDYEGDYLVGVKGFIESFYDEDEKSNLSILDKTFKKVII